MSRWEGTEGRPTGLGDSGTALRGPREEPLLTRQVTGPHRARGPATGGRLETDSCANLELEGKSPQKQGPKGRRQPRGDCPCWPKKHTAADPE